IIQSFGRYRLRLIECDAAVHSDRVYTESDPLTAEAFRFDGGGGTDFRPVLERLAEGEPPPRAGFFHRRLRSGTRSAAAVSDALGADPARSGAGRMGPGAAPAIDGA